MKNLLFILLFIVTSHIYAQENYNSEAFRVTLGDIAAKTFKKDSTANALVIYESGNSYVDNSDYGLRTEIKRKIKILNKDGFDKATVKIYLYNNKNAAESVKEIVATTYNAVGKEVTKTKLEKKDIFTEKYDENHKIVKFTLPNIKEGSVITYSYKLKSRFMFNYKGWNFQEEIPKLYSEYKTSIPGNWDYNIKLVGFKPLDINETELKKNCLEGSRGASAHCSINHYAMKDIPAFIEEDYMTNKSNHIARIEYELKTFRGFDGTVNDYAKTWETVDKDIRTDVNIGKQLSKSIKLEELLSQDIINEQDPLEKANAIYSYVQDNYTWNGKYRIFKDVSVKELIKEKSGNVSSINILLHNLLKESNIDVKPVLLSTRNNGFPTKIFPVISEFNYLIVQATINKKTYLLDATDKFLPFGTLPFRCLNQYARLIDFENGSKWIDLNPKSTSKVFYTANVSIDDNDTFVGTVKSKITGYHAINNTKEFYANRADYIEKIESENDFIEISNFEANCNDRICEAFETSYDVEYNNDEAGDNIYINPFLVVFFNSNPFKLQERTYPIDFGYKDTYYYAFKLNINDGYSVEEIPEDFSISLPNNTGQIIFSSKRFTNDVVVSFKIIFKEAQYAPEYYPYLKDFFSKIVDIQNNSLIVLKKNV